MWIIIGSYIAALVAGFLLGNAFRLARDNKVLEEADTECHRLILENDELKIQLSKMKGMDSNGLS